MDNNDIEIDELINYIKAQIFPTGIIYGYEGVREASKQVEVGARQSWF
jgi:DNA gyrase subunit A